MAELEIPQLDINRAFSYSPRLFRAYADALAAVGREDEAARWQKQAVVAENALGLGVDEEPDIPIGHRNLELFGKFLLDRGKIVAGGDPGSDGLFLLGSEIHRRMRVER